MGNENGIGDAITTRGQNEIIKFDGGYFSFAFGNEIALVIDDSYYILNCGFELFDLVKEQIESKASKKKLISFWKKQSKNYEKSEWSEDFNNL